MTTDRLVWTDLETFGLDPEKDPIIEMGFMITNLELQKLDEFHVLVWEEGVYDHCYKRLKQDADNGIKTAKYVLDMHEKSGLWEAARTHGVSTAEAEVSVLEWLDSVGDTSMDPLCGNNVGFDRSMLKAQMWRIEERFHYRVIDVSSVKELCRRYNPPVYAGLGTKQELHRSGPDLEDTLAEFRFYLDNFLWVAGE